MSLSIGIQNTISQQLSIIINGQANINNAPQRAMLEGSRAERNHVENLSVVEPLTEDTVQVSVLHEGARESIHDAISPSSCTSSRQSGSQAPERCAPWCSCVCHVRHNFSSPWVLETLIGRMNVLYSGPRLECNERKCRSTSTLTGSFAITHHLPTYLMNRYVTLTMRYARLDGPTFVLRAPRVTAWSHLYWTYATKGDLMAI